MSWYRDPTDPTHGYWGPITSTLNWCEQKYRFSPYVAEPVNKVYTVPLDCPPGNRGSYSTKLDADTSKTFFIDCTQTVSQSEGNPAMALLAYHMNDCVEACGAFTDAKGVVCHAIAFHIYLNYNNFPTFNCWLYTGGITNGTAADDSAAAYLIA